MKQTELIVLALAGVAVYMIVKNGGGNSVTSADGKIKSPATWTSADIGNNVALQYQAYAYGRTFL